MCCGIVRIVEDIGKVGGGNDWCQNLEGKNKLFILKQARQAFVGQKRLSCWRE